MEEIVAKKYAHALIQCFEGDELRNLSKLFLRASQAFCMVKFRDMIYSPYVVKNDKKKILHSLFNDERRLSVFLDLLVENNRMDIIPFVSDMLERHLRVVDNSYKAILSAPKSLDSNMIANIASSLSSKLGVKLDIEQSHVRIDGIRLEVQDLGIEVSFLKERFFDDLKTHILRFI